MPEQVAENQDPQLDAGNHDQPTPVVDWKQSLPAEMQSHPAIAKFKTPADLFKGYTEVEKFVGYDKIPAPKKDKDGNYEKGEFERVADALGRPKDPKEYALPKDFKLPDGVKLSDQVLDEFKVAAHKSGMLPGQYQSVLNFFANYLEKGMKAQKEQTDTASKEADFNLRSKWGATYDQKLAVANNVLKNFVSDKATGDAIVAKYGNDPQLIELLANIGSNLSEDSLSKTGMKGTLLDPTQAQAEIMRIREERSKELMDNAHPQHQYWVNKLDELYKMSMM